MANMIGVIRKEVNQMAHKLSNIIRRGVFTLVSSSYFCQVEGFTDERYDDVELWQQYGIASRPPVGGEVLLAKPGNRGEGAIAIATTDRAHRPTDLADGEMVSYGKNTGSGQAQVRHRTDGDLDLYAATGKTVNVGGETDFLLKGTSFNSQHETMLTTIAAAFTALAADPLLAESTTTACTNAASGIAGYLSIAYLLLATKGKVE